MSEEIIDYWNVKVYDGPNERETIRGVTTTQKDVLLSVFDREGVKAQAMAYDDEGGFVRGTETVGKSES
jgi:hypothetical protein